MDAAIRFTKKSIALYDTPTARSLLSELEALQREGRPKANGAEPSKSRPTMPRQNGSSNGSKSRPDGSEASTSKREYTAEQAALVKRIRACQITQYYEILSIEKTAEEGAVKKAYRRLALSLHPDKVCRIP